MGRACGFDLGSFHAFVDIHMCQQWDYKCAAVHCMSLVLVLEVNSLSMLPLPHRTTIGMKRYKHTRTVTQQQTQQDEAPICLTLIFDHKLNQRSHASVVQGMLYLQVIRATSTGRLHQGLQASRAPGGVDGQLGALATRAARVGVAMMISPLLPHLISLNKLWQWA